MSFMFSAAVLFLETIFDPRRLRRTSQHARATAAMMRRETTTATVTVVELELAFLV
eukprot:XP_001709368.1 Hypothetical protein GL50803_113921 [Giardia lamblia ATCC 50803]